MADDAELLKLSEVSKHCGVPIDVIKQLIEDNQLPGAVRGTNGHHYLRADAAPTWQQVHDLVEKQLQAHLVRARDAQRRVAQEVESVGLDIDEAIEHPGQLLGDDLAALDVMGTRIRSRSPLTNALRRLEESVWPVTTYSDFLHELSRVR